MKKLKTNIRFDRKTVGGLLFLAVWLFLFYTFTYSDIMITTLHGLNLWDCLLAGNMREFFSYNYQFEFFNTAYGELATAANYDFIIYVIFAIWNFPLWLVRNMTEIEVLNTWWCLMWSKTLVLVFTCLALRLVQKIGELFHVKEEDARLGGFIFLTSNLFVSSVIVMSQYDIIAVVLMLAGIYYYIKKDTVKWLVFFSLAIPMKYMAALVFIPLLLYRQKNIFKIILDVVLVLLPMVIGRILIPPYGAGNDGMISYFFRNQIASSIYPVPIFIALYIGICFLAYCWKTKTGEAELAEWSIYIGLLTYATFLGASYANPYWAIYLVPFTTLVMMRNRNYLRINALLDAAMTWGLVFAQAINFYWCFNSQLASGMLLSTLLGRNNEKIRVVSMRDQLVALLASGGNAEAVEGVKTYAQCGIAVFLAGLLIFLWINSPGRKKAGLVESEGSEMDVMAIRILTNLFICALPICAYFIAIS